MAGRFISDFIRVYGGTLSNPKYNDLMERFQATPGNTRPSVWMASLMQENS